MAIDLLCCACVIACKEYAGVRHALYNVSCYFVWVCPSPMLLLWYGFKGKLNVARSCSKAHQKFIWPCCFSLYCMLKQLMVVLFELISRLDRCLGFAMCLVYLPSDSKVAICCVDAESRHAVQTLNSINRVELVLKAKQKAIQKQLSTVHSLIAGISCTIGDVVFPNCSVFIDTLASLQMPADYRHVSDCEAS